MQGYFQVFPAPNHMPDVCVFVCVFTCVYVCVSGRVPT